MKCTSRAHTIGCVTKRSAANSKFSEIRSKGDLRPWTGVSKIQEKEKRAREGSLKFHNFRIGNRDIISIELALFRNMWNLRSCGA